MEITLDDAQLSQMNEEGFILLENVFAPSDMLELAEILEAYERRMHQQLVEQGDSGISRAGEITFTNHIAEEDERVAAFVRRPEFVSLATTLLGPDVDLYWNQTVYKHPESEREFPWHQDDGYTPVDPSPYLTLWLAINDATLENGCISVLPGSHKGGLRPHQPSPIGLVGYSNDEPDQGIPTPIGAGGMICFWSLVLHKSRPNRSSGIRRAYIIQYAPKGLRYAASGELVPDLMPIARDGKVVTDSGVG